MSKGRLEVICGPMQSSKSEELIRRLRRAEIAKQRVVAFRAIIDERNRRGRITARSYGDFKATDVLSPEEIITLGREAQVIGIDEVQFFDEKRAELIEDINRLMSYCCRVIISGLDMDFLGKPFDVTAYLMAMADHVEKRTAICVRCGQEAVLTQRLINGEPAPFDSPRKLSGSVPNVIYEPRCRGCHMVPK